MLSAAARQLDDHKARATGLLSLQHGQALTGVVEVMAPYLEAVGGQEVKGKIVIGVVKGDLHETVQSCLNGAEADFFISEPDHGAAAEKGREAREATSDTPSGAGTG